MGTDIADKSFSLVFAVFICYPQTGKVKTNLAGGCGADIAARIYALCAENIFRELKKIGLCSDIVLFYDDRKRAEEIKSWAGSEFIYLAQQGRNQSERMENAFSVLFSRGAEKVCLLFPDVPDLCCSIMEEAAEALGTCDVVLGPALNGGCYLLGLSSFVPGLFKDIDFSTASAAAQTIAKTHEYRLSLALLPRLADIDTVADIYSWLENLPHRHHHPLEEFIYRVGLVRGDQR